MKNKYQSPIIKVVEFKVERGFQASVGFQGTQDAERGIMDFNANNTRNEAYDFSSENFWN